jgi:hypothetical protein|nr:MAG TPA: hypothetical protein [Caudoviricetes sp.]
MEIPELNVLSSNLRAVSAAVSQCHPDSSETIQLKKLNDMNQSIISELQKSNQRVSSLETDLNQIKNSHKHDFIKQIFLGIFCAIIGSAATVIIERLIGL